MFQFLKVQMTTTHFNHFTSTATQLQFTTTHTTRLHSATIETQLALQQFCHAKLIVFSLLRCPFLPTSTYACLHRFFFFFFFTALSASKPVNSTFLLVQQQTLHQQSVSIFVCLEPDWLIKLNRSRNKCSNTMRI